MTTMSGAEPFQSRIQELLPVFLPVFRGQGVEPSSAGFPGRKQGAELEVEQMGFERTIRDAGVARSLNLPHYSPWLVSLIY